MNRKKSRVSIENPQTNSHDTNKDAPINIQGGGIQAPTTKTTKPTLH